jgi:hypothetical protein
MIQLGPIVMPCRTCQADPGEPCTVRGRLLGDPGVTFHEKRKRDAELASELIAEPTALEARLATAAAKRGSAMYAKMQRRGFVKAMDRAFSASPQELGATAVKAALGEDAE